MQHCLIGHRAGQQGIAVVCQRDRQAAKPVRPFPAEVSL